MRRQLKNFLPIFLIALAVQIFAPIAACWAAGIAGSDPLAGAVICHGGGPANPGQADGQGGTDHARDGCCSVCSVLHTGAPVDVPEIVTSVLQPPSHQVAWQELVPGLIGSAANSSAQARAPPTIS